MSLKKIILGITGFISVAAAVVAVIPKAGVIWEFILREEPTLTLTPVEIEVNSKSEVNWVEYIYSTQSGVKDDFILEVVTSNVDLAIVGDYEVVFEAKSSKGNIENHTLNVSVVDTTAPVFTMFNQTFEKGTTNQIDWAQLATAVSDNSNQPVQFSVRSGLPNNADVGTYDVIVIAADASNNTTERPIVVQVVDTTKPTISAQNIQVNYKSEPLNWMNLFQVTDNSNTTKLITWNNVNLNQIGTYEIELTATDTYNNIQTKTIQVEVVPLNIDGIVIINQYIEKTENICTHTVLGACTGADEWFLMEVNADVIDLGYEFEFVSFFYFDPWTDTYIKLGDNVDIFGEHLFHFEDIYSRYDLSHTDANLSKHSYKIIYYYRNPSTNVIESFEYIFDWQNE
ncbi:hypothetical protein [Paracholeplasma manati]|uniref:hypothetical protein n=1 Tax=Paracholeplasma manati TaxID=591373 RepID=UPI002407BF78|nr:hypothetical protein [Paracholeplasma manati]MDG0888937.1 hypothetical protein [Paracholeplasma manati]